MRWASRACLAAALGTAVPLPVAGPGSAEPLSIVVSPTFAPAPADKSGSTVTVITADEIARSSAGSLADVLRLAPGVTVTESGGAGGQALVNLRGAEPGHTLVLIDGIRVNDPASARDEFDFSLLSFTDIERIEVLKGPQSALYGSDAIGGVINIITRKGSGPRASATVEAGSYGTRRTTLSGGGASGPVSLNGSFTYFADDGFSRVGDRDHGEPDGTEKYAGTIRGSVDGGEGRKLEFGLDGEHQASDLDKSATVDAPGYTSDRDLLSGYARFILPGDTGRPDQSLTAFATETTRAFAEPTAPPRVTDYRGTDIGAEYQRTRSLGTWGTLLSGARFEEVTAFQQRTDQADPAVDGRALLYAGYLLYQVPIGTRLNLSFAGRHDGEVDAEGFTTGRFTLAYDIAETGTHLHASLGSGAKRPTAFEIAYNPTLAPERSVGADLGVEQRLFGGRLSLSATGFWNDFRDLIDYDLGASTYRNITSAQTAGVEVSASAAIIPKVLTGALTYTYLTTRDLVTGEPLERRPAHSGKATLTYTGIDRLTASVSLTYVGARYNDDTATVRLPAYARVDLGATYALNDRWTAFGRVENLFNVRYQEAAGYNTAGLSAYAGLTWTGK